MSSPQLSAQNQPPLGITDWEGAMKALSAGEGERAKAAAANIVAQPTAPRAAGVGETAVHAAVTAANLPRSSRAPEAPGSRDWLGGDENQGGSQWGDADAPPPIRGITT